MRITIHALTATEQGLQIVFDTPYGPGIGYWMSDSIEESRSYTVEFSINDLFIFGQNIHRIDEHVYRLNVQEQSNHIQGRIMNYQGTHVLEIEGTNIMLGDIDQGFDNQWAMIIVPATHLKIYDCNY